MEIFLYDEKKLPWQGSPVSPSLHLLSHCFKQTTQNGVGALGFQSDLQDQGFFNISDV